jgi:serine protease
VAPGVKVLPVRVLGKCGGYESDITAGMRWAAGIAVAGLPANANPARVINMSLGGEGSCSQVYADAVREVIAKGAAVVVAAGNSAGHALGQPANCTGVISVAGVRHVGTKVGYSDVGPSVTLSAPAGNCENTSVNDPCLYPILSSTNRGPQGPVAADASYTTGATVLTAPVGTSFAAPLVAGTAALMLSANPNLTPAQLATLLQSSSRAFPTAGGSPGTTQCRAPTAVDQLECYCTSSTCGAGMLDTAAAVQAAATFVGPLAVSLSPASTQGTVGQAVTLTAGSVAGTGTLTYAWAVVSGASVVSLPANATGASVVATFTGAGTAEVQMTVTDSTGRQGTAVWTGTATAAVAPADSGGGGAVAPAELAALLLALAAAVGMRRRGT